MQSYVVMWCETTIDLEFCYTDDEYHETEFESLDAAQNFANYIHSKKLCRVIGLKLVSLMDVPSVTWPIKLAVRLVQLMNWISHKLNSKPSS